MNVCNKCGYIGMSDCGCTDHDCEKGCPPDKKEYPQDKEGFCIFCGCKPCVCKYE